MVSFWRRPTADAAAPSSEVAVVSRAVPAWRLAACALLMLVNAAISGLLLLQHYHVERAVSAVGQVCGEGATSGCETVARSGYSELRGVPLAAIGLGFSLSLFVLLLLAGTAGPEARTAAAVIAFLALAAALAVDAVLLRSEER